MDGAFQGVKAGDALLSVVSGRPSPPRMTEEEFASYILSAPDGLVAEGADDAGRWLAKKLLQVYRRVGPTEDIRPHLRLILSLDELREAELFGGFVWGWAENAARRLMGMEMRPNPYLLPLATMFMGKELDA